MGEIDFLVDLLRQGRVLANIHLDGRRPNVPSIYDMADGGRFGLYRPLGRQGDMAFRREQAIR